MLTGKDASGGVSIVADAIRESRWGGSIPPTPHLVLGQYITETRLCVIV